MRVVGSHTRSRLEKMPQPYLDSKLLYIVHRLGAYGGEENGDGQTFDPLFLMIRNNLEIA